MRVSFRPVSWILSLSVPALRPVLLGSAFALAPAVLAGPWEPLFDGKTLTGWKQLGGAAPYAVVDGAIVGTTVSGTPNSFLATEKSFGDFIFECEMRQEGGGTNSGVQFRSESRPDYQSGRVHGYQLEIDPTPRAWSGGIYDEGRRGWLYPGTLNPSARDLYQLERWNHLRIEAIGTSIRTWINGVPVAHVIDDLTPKGFIALQVHSVGNQPGQAGRRILWRNLRIQTSELTASPADALYVRNLMPNAISAVEKAQGWRLLWDGSTRTGWRGVNQTTFPSGGWTMANGELSISPPAKEGEKRAGGDIVTEETFSAFELAFDFKLTPGANSGVKYFAVEKNPGGALGLEFQVLDDEKHPDAKMGAGGNRTLGSLYDLIPRSPLPGGLAIVPRVGEWQHARIVVYPDNRVEHWLNGVKVVEYVRGSPLFRALVARSKFEKNADFGLAPEGRVLLQDHGDQVSFRSIKIRTLK
ncbi:MAG: DUF1080 domain-containing protein [Opitutaceae bacterium]